jgi:predicted N-formylglutamate amidohydrolase
MTSDDLLLTCEHGGHQVPSAYADLFTGHSAARALRSHRGWDPGALDIARAFARRTGAPLHAARVSRLLVELNRSPHHPRLLSEFSARLSDSQRLQLLARYYHPYRNAVEHAIRQRIDAGQSVLHVSVHTFAGTWHGQARRADVGFLYDPARAGERQLCAAWQARLQERAPALRVRRNYPYRGVADGLVTFLRRHFGVRRYIAIELEVSQTLVATPGETRRQVIDAVIDSFLQTLH